MEAERAKKLSNLILIRANMIEAEDEEKLFLYDQGVEVACRAISKYGPKAERGCYSGKHKLYHYVSKRLIGTQWLKYPEHFTELRRDIVDSLHSILLEC